MIHKRSFLRRSSVVFVALCASTLILHAQLADALVVRGDELAARGMLPRAEAMYERAIFLDPRSSVSVDRLLFAAILSHRGDRLRNAISRSSTYLRNVPTDDTVRMDRALALQMDGRLTQAECEFQRVGVERRDARALLFAGLDELRGGKRAAAHRLFAMAHRIDPSFAPASRRLAGS